MIKSVLALLAILTITAGASAVKIVSDVSPRSSTIHIPGVRHVVTSLDTAIDFDAK